MTERIRETAMLALSYGAGHAINKKEAALREIYELASLPTSPEQAQEKNENDLGAQSATAVATAGSSASPELSHVDWLKEQPEFEDGDYPTDWTLDLIRRWPIEHTNRGLDFVADAWHWPEFGVSRELRPEEAVVAHAEPGERHLRLATGGWSGNESIVAAMRENFAFMCRWRLSGSGGLHIYAYYPAVGSGNQVSPEPSDATRRSESA